jgi:hypothetical protein
MNPPPGGDRAATPRPKYHARDRGGCLTFFLLFLILFHVSTLASLFIFVGSDVELLGVAMPGWSRTVLMILSIIDIALIVAIFNWKRWAAVALVASDLAASGIYLSMGTGVLPQLISTVLLIVLVRRIWGEME